jgi:hypothetical protein
MPNSLKELDTAIQRFPDAVTASLKQIANRTAHVVAVRAAEILNHKTHGTGKTAASIRVLDESDHKTFLVNCPGDPERPANLPMWLEFGTKFMTARSFMRPAGDESEQGYIRDMTKAAEGTAQKVLGG